MCCVLFCYEYTEILPLEDYQENTERVSVTCKRRLIYIFSNSFHLLSLSLLYKSFPLTHTQTHTHGRPLAPAAIINRAFHFSRLKATLSRTECDSDATEVRHTAAFAFHIHIKTAGNSKSTVLIALCHNDTRDRHNFRESSLKVNTGLRIQQTNS